jgi:hypothetical protein
MWSAFTRRANNGQRKVLCYKAKDIDDWANMFARCYSYAAAHRGQDPDIVDTGVWTAGWGFQNGCERRVHVHPHRPGETDMQCQSLETSGRRSDLYRFHGPSHGGIIEAKGLRGRSR